MVKRVSYDRLRSETLSGEQPNEKVNNAYKCQVGDNSLLTMAALTTRNQCGFFPRRSILGKGVGKVMEGMTCYISIWSDMLSVIRECTDFDQVTRKAVR